MLATSSLTSLDPAHAARPARCTASEAFLESVAQRCGSRSNEQLRQVVFHALALLAARLRPVDARAVAAKLPPQLGTAFAAPLSSPHTAAQELTALPTSQLRAICQVLAEHLDAQARTQLRIQPLSRLFASAA